MSLLVVSAVGKKEQDELVLDNISFVQEPSQRIAIAGATGSGKTTLLKIIAGLTEPTEGTSVFNGERLEGPNEKLIAGHPDIAYLSQHFELRNHYRVIEILEMASKVSLDAATRIYDVCRISHLLKRWTHQLSGGEKQRIALARLLITSPKLLLLDEPYSNLDPFHKSILKNVISELGEKLNITSILVSHDPVDTLSWSNEILILQNGKLIQRGNPKEIYYKPVNEYAAGLFGEYNLLDDEFASLFGIGTNKKFVRPEEFILAKEGGGISANVTNVKFMGSFYRLEVTTNGFPLVIYTQCWSLSIGEKVYLKLNENPL